MNTAYKNQHRSAHYDRIELAVPKGMKQVIMDLARDRHMSVSSYLQDLVRKDQEGMFDTMQIAEKTKKEVRSVIIQYLTEDSGSLP